MKRLALLAFLLPACGTLSDSSTRQSSVVSGLVAAWGFDEASGTTAADATCNGHTAALNGQTHAPGKYGSALAYSGSFATVADAADLHLSAGMTLEAWVYPTSLPSATFACVLMKERPGELTYDLYANSGGNTPELDYSSGSPAAEHNLTGGSALALDTWTHLAGTFDGATMRLYVNGVQTAAKPSTGAIFASTDPLRFGGNSVWNESFNGRLDEIRIYNRALSAAEIATDRDTPVGAGSCGGTGAGGTGGGSGSGGTAGRAGSAGSGGTAAPGGSGGPAGRGGSAGSGGSGGSAGAAAPGGSGGPAGRGGSAGAAGRGGSAGSGGSGGSAGSAGSAGSTSAVYPLQLAPGKHYLVDQQSRPFFMVGDAAWSLAVSISTSDADAYLADRQARGFNTVLVNLIEHKFTTQPAPRNAAGDLPFRGTLPGGAPDFSTPNDAYFAHVDAVLNAAAARGIQVLLVPAYLGYQGGDEGWYTTMVSNGTSRLSTYGRYVGARYTSFPNLIWVAGADYNPPDTSLTNAVETAIKAADPRHLHTGHQNSGTSAKDEWGWSSWLTVDDVYGYPANSQFIWQMARTAYTRSGWLPFFLIESTYEHSTWTSSPPQLLRQQAYEAILNGGFGQLFGNEWLWPFGGPDVSGAVHDWRSVLDSPSTRDMTRLATFFKSRRWDTLVPDVNHAFLTIGASTGSAFASAALASDGTFGVVYTPTQRNLGVNMAKLSGSTTVRWYNPATGSYTTVAGSPFANTGSRFFSPPGAGDWVLVLEAI